MEEFDSNH